MKKLNIRKAWTFQLTLEDMETPVGASMTIQADSYTIRELLTQHSVDLRRDLTRQVSWDEDPDIDGLDREKIKRLDIVDRNELASTNLEYLKELQARAKQDQAKAVEKEARKQNESEAKEAAKSDQQDSPEPDEAKA